MTVLFLSTDFHFVAQSATPWVSNPNMLGAVLGSDVSNRKTNAFGKSDEKACNWAFLSAMAALQTRAQQMGANAVIKIVSYYNKKVMSSAAEFECHAGAIIAGVALKGDFVKISDG